MTKTEDKVKSVLEDMNKEHLNEIGQKISGIFLFGFMMGVVFSYTSIMGFSAGFLTGIVVRNNFTTKTNEYVEKTVNSCYNIINMVKTMVKTN